MNPIRFATYLHGTVYSADESSRRVVIVYDEPARQGTRPVPVEIRWDGSPLPQRGEIVDVPCIVSLFSRREGGLGYVVFRALAPAPDGNGSSSGLFAGAGSGLVDADKRRRSG